MCNACGFYCCGSDEFGGCGCDGCPEPECWSDDEDFFEGDGHDLDFASRRCCSAPRRFECIEVGEVPA